MKASVSLVEDDNITRAALEDRLTGAGYVVEPFTEATSALKRFRQNPTDVVITDVRLPGMSGLELLSEIKKERSETAVIVITGYGTIDDAVLAMREGAYDYLPKPVTAQALLIKLARVLEFRQAVAERKRLQHELEQRYDYANVIGRSRSMQQAFEVAEVVKDLDSTVLIWGETGVGKEVLGRAIHFSSERRGQPFVPVSCVIFSREILESELFGHEKGAFTGAYRRKTGRFEAAGEGTIFLDDVDDIPVGLQVKLLRVLQEKRFERVGGEASIPMRCRIICAAKRNLAHLVEEGTFRKDLFFRMNVVPIKLPPLRERREDIPLLVDHFVRVYAEGLGKPVPEVRPTEMQLLLDYDWPGNVRELENVIERAVAFCRGDALNAQHFPGEITEGDRHAEPVKLNLPASEPIDFSGLTGKVEREIIEWALLVNDGNQVKAARFLSLPRSTLQNKMKRLGVQAARQEH